MAVGRSAPVDAELLVELTDGVDGAVVDVGHQSGNPVEGGIGALVLTLEESRRERVGHRSAHGPTPAGPGCRSGGRDVEGQVRSDAPR